MKLSHLDISFSFPGDSRCEHSRAAVWGGGFHKSLHHFCQGCPGPSHPSGEQGNTTALSSCSSSKQLPEHTSTIPFTWWFWSFRHLDGKNQASLPGRNLVNTNKTSLTCFLNLYISKSPFFLQIFQSMIKSKIHYSELHCFCFNYCFSTDCVHTLPEICTRVMILEEFKGGYTI